MGSMHEGLLGARPEARMSRMSALGRTGVNVRVARHPDRAPRCSARTIATS